MQPKQFFAITSPKLPDDFGILSEDGTATDTVLFGVLREDFSQRISAMAEDGQGKMIVPEGTQFFGMLFGDGTHFDMEAIEAESEWGVIGTIEKDDVGDDLRIVSADGTVLLELTAGIDQIPRVYSPDLFAFEAPMERCA